MDRQLTTAFTKRIEPIEVIFDSYRALFEMYTETLKTANVNSNALKAFQNCKKTVNKKQNSMSNSLHTQAFILLTGAAEAFIKDVFDDLIQENFLSIRKASGINYSLTDLPNILEQNEDSDFVSLELANITIKQIHNAKNNNEKINFQNIKSMNDTFKEYFGVSINLDEGYIKNIHKYWQMRHAIVHTNSKVDERYKNNVERIGFVSEEIGSKVVISKKVYDEVKCDFSTLFEKMEGVLIEKNLQFKGVV